MVAPNIRERKARSVRPRITLNVAAARDPADLAHRDHRRNQARDIVGNVHGSWYLKSAALWD